MNSIKQNNKWYKNLSINNTINDLKLIEKYNKPGISDEAWGFRNKKEEDDFNKRIEFENFIHKNKYK